MLRMSWLLFSACACLQGRFSRNHLASSIGERGEGPWEMSLNQAQEVVEALNYYSAGDLKEKLERITGHGTTKPNDARYPNQHDKNRRVELSLVLDMSKNDLAQFKNNWYDNCF